MHTDGNCNYIHSNYYMEQNREKLKKMRRKMKKMKNEGKNSKKLLFLFLLIVSCSITGCGKKEAASEKPVSEYSVSESDTNEPADSSTENNQDYYSVCTDLSKEAVESFAKQIRQQILDEDWNALSENIAYPIVVCGTTYNNKEEFAEEDLSDVFTEEFVKTIEQESCEDMLCSWQGIMLGNGEIWIAEVLNDDMTSQGLKVIAIN